MADAESNLVPSEAADQVEVALEEQAEDLDEERELLDTDVEDVEAVEDFEALVVDETSENMHDED